MLACDTEDVTRGDAALPEEPGAAAGAAPAVVARAAAREEPGAPAGAESAPVTAEVSPDYDVEPKASTGSGEGGLVGRLREKVGSTVEKVSEIESVQKGMQFVVGKSKQVQQKVAESERLQQGVEFVKKKTTELAENESVQKGLEIAKDTAKVVTERTQQGLEFAKEKSKAVATGASSVWEKGKGSVKRVRANVSQVAWKGSARDTLDIAAREEQWKDIKVQGAEEISVPARTEHTCAFHVTRGSTLRWTFRVKEHDIGFGVRMRVQEWGGSKEDEVLAVERYDSADTISGSWVADEDRTMILAFDNRYSRLRSKTVAYLVGTERPPVFSPAERRPSAPPPSEASAETASASSSPTAVPSAVAAPAGARAPASAAPAAPDLAADPRLHPSGRPIV